MRTATGLDVLASEGFSHLHGRAVGLLCNQASVDRRYDHILDLLAPLHQNGRLRLRAVFGPQHGLYGHTQDNMIEWESDGGDGIPTYSLYGHHRKPTPEMLEGIDLFVIDVPDVGSRYYTFAWTMAYCIEACAEAGIPVLVLDRPNPIGGLQVEGALLDPTFRSFVGLYPTPTRHGMTAGEVARYVRSRFVPNADLEIAEVRGWARREYLDETDAPWAMPSPNMPTVETAVVYPGGCLLEGTNLSEGRGTTRPFEIFGAPFLDGYRLADSLNGIGLPGVKFRPIQFVPTFNKHKGRHCEGCFVHVLDRRVFEPVLAYVAILQESFRQGGERDAQLRPADPEARFTTEGPEMDAAGFAWRQPPYEYEYEKWPIDVLAGNAWLRPAVEELRPLEEIRRRFREECAEFEPIRQDCLLYPAI